MSKRFDPTLNRLIDLQPTEWANYFATRFEIPLGPVSVLDTDLATSVQADKIFLIQSKSPVIIHLEFESSSRLGIPQELMRYNTLIDFANQCEYPVISIFILLRPKAIASDQTGTFQRLWPNGRIYQSFVYEVIRLWEEPFESLFHAGIALAPLAMITDEAHANLTESFGQFQALLSRSDVTRELAQDIMSSTYFLSGLRRNPHQLLRLLNDMSTILEDSTTYQKVLRKGKAEGKVEGKAEGIAEAKLQERHKMILELGKRRFGPAKPKMVKTLNAITDLDRLERMVLRILDASAWDDLLGTP